MTISKPLLCSHTTYQAISNELPWSEYLAPITNSLRMALPTSMDRIDTAKLSNDGLALYRELMDTCTAIPRFEINSSTTPVTDVIDTILTSVAQLRVLARRPGMENAKESTVVALLHILGLVCSSNAVAMACAPFLLPRSLHPTVLEQLECESYSSLLVGVSFFTGTNVHTEGSGMEKTCLDAKLQAISDIPAPLATFDADRASKDPAEQTTSPMEVDKFEGSLIDADSQACSDRHMASSGTLSSTKFRKAPTPALNMPFDAHVLPGRGVRTNCYLPALCVANDRNINALITSVAYQRHVFGISLPVVGICLYSTPSTIFARVLIGWIDGMVGSCRIPSVRIAASESIVTNSPSTGVFDLIDPCAATLLAQFILNLSPHFNALSKAQFAPGDHHVSWRADQTILYSTSLNPCCMDFMKEWNDQIHGPHADTMTNSILYSVDIAKSEVLSNTRSTAPSESYADDGLPSLLPDSSKNIKREEILRATSSALSPTSFKPTSCICKDLHTSGVIALAAVSHKIRIKHLDGDLNAKLRVRDSVYATLALYFSITSPPQWPNDWIDGANIFGGDPVYGYLEKMLLQDIEACRKAEPKKLKPWEKALPHHDFQADDIVGFALFLNHVSPFFLSVATARGSLFEKTVPSLEGENRCNWDWILQIACSEIGDTLGCHNWLEHKIPSPTACDKTVPDWCQLFALQSDIALDQGTFYPFGQIPGSRGILEYFGDALFHIDALKSNGESASASDQHWDTDHSSIIASLLVARDVDGDGYVRHVTSEGSSSSFCSKRTSNDSLTTLAVLHRQSSQTKEQALDQCCLCMVSLLSSLKSVGLSAPVFGVVTDQTECTLLSAMQDQKTGYNLVVREAAVRYDLTKPLDALRLFMTLHRIFRRQSEAFALLKMK